MTASADPMARLREKYINRLAQEGAALREFAWPDNTATLAQADLPGLQVLAHKLAGSGATYGFKSISVSARALEELILKHGAPTGELAAKISDLLHAIENVEETAPQLTMSRDAEATDTEADAPFDTHRPRIIVIDDDLAITDLLQSMIEDKADLQIFHDSISGLEAINNEHPDVVLLDNGNPGGLSGTEILKQLRADEETEDLPVLMLTATDAPDVVMDALIAGATDYITKPFDVTEVKRKLDACIRRANARILVVDDDEVIRDLLHHRFSNIGYRAVTAADGSEAWDLIQAEDFALVILDQMMPGLSGVTLLRKMKECSRTAQIPVVFLTARRDGNDVVEGIEAGAADYIVKPFDPQEVLVRCSKLIEHRA